MLKLAFTCHCSYVCSPTSASITLSPPPLLKISEASLLLYSQTLVLLHPADLPLRSPCLHILYREIPKLWGSDSTQTRAKRWLANFVFCASTNKKSLTRPRTPDSP